MNGDSPGAPRIPARPSPSRNALWIASVALLYFGAARLGLFFQFRPENIAAVWPPAGIFLSALLLSRRDLRPWLAGTLFVTDFIAERLAGTPSLVSAIYALALTGDAVLSCWLLLRFVGDPFTFKHVRAVAGWLALSVLLSNGLTSLAAAAAATLVPGTHSFGTSWIWWAASDGVGNLLLTPLILGWAVWDGSHSRRNRRRRVLEGVVLFASLALLNLTLFGFLSDHAIFALFLPYVSFPFLVWAALRFGVRGVATATFTLAAIAVPFAASGRVWVFSFAPGVLDEVIVVQLFLAITAVPSLFLAAVVTERQHEHDALREAEELHRVTLRSVGDAVISTDVQGRVRLANPVAETLLGWPEKDARGKRLDEVFRIVNEDTRLAVESPVERVLREGAVVGLANHTLLLARDGTERPIADSGAPIRDEAGGVVGVVLVFRDQTEERAAAAALRDSERRLRDIIFSLGDWVWEVDARGVYTYSSAKGGELLGDVLGKTPFDFMPPGEAERVAALFSDLAAHKAPIRDLENWNVRKDGERVCLLTNGVPVLDAAGNLKGYRGVDKDITERKQLEANFLRAQRLEGIGALAGGIAHDLNNLLTPIIMTVPFLRATAGDAESLEMIETIETCAQRGAGIIGQLLTFARGKPGVHMSVPVRRLLYEMDKLAQETFPRNIRTRVSAPDDLWPILGDATQVHQALMNLCVNARDAMPSGGTITLAAGNLALDEAFATLAPDAKPGSYVCVSVADTGTGILPEIRDRIFDPFFTTKDVGKGTGLGLPTVLGIVRGHGGFLRVDSRPGQGTTIELYFPASPGATAAAPHVDLPPPRGRNELILVVDDEHGLRNTVKRLLEQHGYRVVTAEEGGRALALLAQHGAAVRAVITDLMMPGMDGPALIAALRRLHPRVPILGMTGLAEHGAAQGMDGLDPHAILAKPFESARLLAALREMLDAAGTQA